MTAVKILGLWTALEALKFRTDLGNTPSWAKIQTQCLLLRLRQATEILTDMMRSPVVATIQINPPSLHLTAFHFILLMFYCVAQYMV